MFAKLTTLFHFELNYIPCDPWKSPLLKLKLFYLPLIPKYLRIFSFFSISDWIQNGIKLRFYYIYCEIKAEQENFQEIFFSPLISL